MPASVRPAWRLRLRQAKSAERDCCNYCQCLFHVFVSLRRMIAPLLTIDRKPHAAVTKKSRRPERSREIPARHLKVFATGSLGFRSG